VHVDFDAAGQGAGGRGVDVEGAPAAVPVLVVLILRGWGKDGGGRGVPEVVGAVFVGDDEDGDGGVGRDGVDAVGGGRVVFPCVCG